MCTFRKHTRLQSIAENEFSKKTMLTEFFWMNANDPQAKATKYFYKDFPTSFVWNKQSKTWKARQQKDVIGRIVSANPNEGERYYLRLLLTHIPGPTSYMDLRTVNGIVYSTFREAAIANGILEDDQSDDKCMEEGSLTQTESISHLISHSSWRNYDVVFCESAKCF